MLKLPEHQVAGHKAKDGGLGPLIDGSGKFYKPLQQNDHRGSTELSFYSSLYVSLPLSIQSFFPSFHGTQLLDASDGSGLQPHLILQDLLCGYTKPSVMDIKIGSRTWHLGDSEDYINKCLNKDRDSSSIPLGFRISGVKDSLSSWEPTRNFLHNLSSHDVTLLLKNFVSSNTADTDLDPDCRFASLVYSAVLDRLLQLKAWFEVQTLYHFYSTSILLVYDKDNNHNHNHNHNQGKVLVKLVDFAHVVAANGVIDHNFLGGLCSFINFLKDILAALPT